MYGEMVQCVYFLKITWKTSHMQIIPHKLWIQGFYQFKDASN